MSIPRSPEATREQIAKANVIVVDCRSQEELVRDPKVDGALHIWCPYHARENVVNEAIESGLLPENKETPIVAYCAVGGRSGMFLEQLASLGYTDLVNGVNTTQMREALG
eukprot:g4277.t1